jgi:hypothetical protein
MKSVGKLLFEVDMRKIGFPELLHEIRPLKFFFLFLQRLQVGKAVIGYRPYQVGFRVLNLLLLGIKPLDEGFLNNIFSIGFAALQAHGNRVKRGLV